MLELLANVAVFWWVVLWIVCVITVAMAAEERGRNGGAWALLAILFGPVALVMLIAFPESIRSPGSKRFQQCPECREWVRRDARRCKYCVANLKPTTVMPTAPARSSSSTTTP